MNTHEKHPDDRDDARPDRTGTKKPHAVGPKIPGCGDDDWDITGKEAVDDFGMVNPNAVGSKPPPFGDGDDER